MKLKLMQANFQMKKDDIYGLKTVGLITPKSFRKEEYDRLRFKLRNNFDHINRNEQVLEKEALGRGTLN